MAMQELDIETLTIRDGGKVHFVKDYEEGKSGEGAYALTFCGRWAAEEWVVNRKYSTVAPSSWCGPCYNSRRKAIENEVRRDG